MKVLLISSSSGSHGGGEFYLKFLADGLADLGCTVIALMSDGEHMDGLADMMAGNCQIERIPLVNTYHRKTRTIGSVLDLAQIRRIQDSINAIAPDIVHLNKQCVDDGLSLIKGAVSSGRPAVTTIHVTRSMKSLNAALGSIRDWISVKTMQQASLPTITVSERSSIDWQQLIPDSNVSVVPNGTPRLLTDARLTIRQRWGIKDDDIALGTIARIEEQKNPLFLPRVIAGLPNHVHMFWVGDGRMRAALEAEIDRLNVADRFHLLGWKDNAKALLPGFDVFVLPSLYEGFPFAILEAMSAGLPCVVSDVDGNGESVVDGQTGFVLPVNDFVHWTSRLQELIDQPSLRARFGGAALQRFEEEYHVSVMARRTIAVYKKVIEQHGSLTPKKNEIPQ